MSKLATQAERLKLARLLDVPGDALSALDTLDAGTLRGLREQASNAFFEADAQMFQRIALASKLLPAAAIALIAEKVLGPMLSGRVAGQLSPESAVAVAKRLPTPFLAELSLSLDPQRAEAIIAAIPPARIAEIAVELSQRQEFISMARFVDVISDAAIRAVLAALRDNAALLKVAFFIERKARLNDILGLLDEARLVAVIEAAAAEDDLWPEALGLLEYVDVSWKATLGNLAAGLDPQVLDTMVASVHRNDLWTAALPVVTHMSAESQARFANLARLQNESVMADLMRAAGADGLWAQVLPLVPQMDEAGRALAARLSAGLDGEQLLAVAAAATEQQHWPVVIDLIQLMAPEQQQTVFGLLGVAPARALDGLLQALESEGQWALLDAALPSIPTMHQSRLAERGAALGFATHFSGVNVSAPVNPRDPISRATSPPTKTVGQGSVAETAHDFATLTRDLKTLKQAQQALRADLRQALDARTDLQDLLNATAHANRTLRQQMRQNARWTGLAITLALAAAGLAIFALLR